MSGTKKPKSQKSKGLLARANTTLRSPPHPFSGSIPLHDLLPLLSPQETSFIDALDKELDKIEDFYDARKKEMETRSKLLEAQLIELNVHQQRFNEAQAGSSRWNIMLHSKKTHEIEGNLPNIDSGHLPSSKRNSLHHHLDPEEYQTAKKKLNKAVFEHYRGLEMLQNYRFDFMQILNITGFRKALKKFEKVTRIPVQHAYMAERVETSAFASDKTLRAMMDEMEALYASHFAHGDQKRAKTRLRAGGVNKTHHYTSPFIFSPYQAF
ncbi:hypothetical protein HHX47_DHR2001164 [Lentinula edodes]|nr:hypothetical protein HHX47_DHR2001164 [Lentinula edodes]